MQIRRRQPAAMQFNATLTADPLRQRQRSEGTWMNPERLTPQPEGMGEEKRKFGKQKAEKGVHPHQKFAQAARTFKDTDAEAFQGA